jgi:hypothetical protein
MVGWRSKAWCSTQAAEPAARPNILFVLADQWRAQALGYAGDANVKTPHLDALQREFAQRNQIRRAEKIAQSALRPFQRIDISAPHAILPTHFICGYRQPRRIAVGVMGWRSTGFGPM